MNKNNELIKLIILDVDGTLTTGGIIYSDNGTETKEFNVKDGATIKYWNDVLGLKSAIITGRKSSTVERRVKDLDITYLYQNEHSKQEKVQEILDKEGLTWNNVAIIGDDLNDYKMLSKAAMSFCPKDCDKGLLEIKGIKKLSKKGGKGCVRQMINHIIDKNNYETMLNHFKK